MGAGGASDEGGAVVASAGGVLSGIGFLRCGTGLCFLTILWGFSGLGNGTGGLGAGDGGAVTLDGSTGAGSGMDCVCFGPIGASVGGVGVDTGSGAMSMAIAAGGGSGTAITGGGRRIIHQTALPQTASTERKDSPQRSASSRRVSRSCLDCQLAKDSGLFPVEVLTISVMSIALLMVSHLRRCLLADQSAGRDRADTAKIQLQYSCRIAVECAGLV